VTSPSTGDVEQPGVIAGLKPGAQIVYKEFGFFIISLMIQEMIIG
jgi:hypothetical protein